METKKPPILIKRNRRVRKLRIKGDFLQLEGRYLIQGRDCEPKLRPVDYVMYANFGSVGFLPVTVKHTWIVFGADYTAPMPRYYRLEVVVNGETRCRVMNQRQMREFVDKYDPPYTMAAVGG